MEYISKFDERLSEFLFDHKMNAKQLAAALGIAESPISEWRNNKKSISMPSIILISDYFRCSIDYLIGRSDTDSEYNPKPLTPFPKRVREVMAEKGWTRYRLDKETRIKDSYFTNWDKGQLPKLTTLIELADIFDVSIDYLVGRER